VATVVEGKVTAVATGTATITVTTTDGNKKATCEVTVTAATVAVTGVTLSETTLDLLVGANATLIATVAPEEATNPTVSWESSDVNIATVDNNGKVTAINVGDATITVTTASGNKKAACKVTVTPVAVTDVTLNKTTLDLLVGANATLTATVAPNNATDKTVTWESSNTSVATVSSSGVVTAVAEGTATITATAGDKTASCAVTVTPVAVTGVTLNKTTLAVAKGANATLIATVLPANATDKTVTWESSNTWIATVSSSGVVTPVLEGFATITATAGDKTATCEVTVYDPVNEDGVVINGVKWATRNVDAPGTFAATPDAYGMFYQWNRNIGWSSTNPRINSNGGTTWDSTSPTGDAWAPDNDPSPDGWRIPTLEEQQTLLDTDNVESQWVTGSLKGWLFTDKTSGASLFLPAAGYRYYDDGRLYNAGTSGYYWSSTANSAYNNVYYHYLHFDSSSGADCLSTRYRTNGFPVRCVAE
ncbi:MAG: Ig-like domain-containing protein, partial [Bacteroidales bacterium]|nr:Ig-like domain-containing protein [Bacteroidales bacterium]